MGLLSDLAGKIEDVIAKEGGTNQLFSQALAGMGGYQGILAKLNQAGLGGVVSSWVGIGSNQAITPEQIQAALGNQHLQQLAASFGVPTDQIASFLSQHLPTAVDQASPNGTLPPPGQQAAAATTRGPPT